MTWNQTDFSKINEFTTVWAQESVRGDIISDEKEESSSLYIWDWCKESSWALKYNQNTAVDCI